MTLHIKVWEEFRHLSQSHHLQGRSLCGVPNSRQDLYLVFHLSRCLRRNKIFSWGGKGFSPSSQNVGVMVFSMPSSGALGQSMLTRNSTSTHIWCPYYRNVSRRQFLIHQSCTFPFRCYQAETPIVRETLSATSAASAESAALSAFSH